MKNFFIIILLAAFLPLNAIAQYTGTGSVTHGLASTTVTNLYSCTGGRVTNLGTITASDNSVWTVPAVVNFTNGSFPFASDLYNQCNGHTYATSAAALAALNGSDIITVNPGGEVITAYIFGDNYFEMYINGVPVGKDNVPYTPFNSNIVRFRVNRPFTIAMLLVDWEENLGLGSENNSGFAYYPGDGGMVAVFKDAQNNNVAITGSNWKAQTFYTAPIQDLSCPTENGTLRSSVNCSVQSTNNGANFYGLHWQRPANWMNASFDDSQWQNASVYTNEVVGVNNKPAYTNFTNIFDDPANDAKFIWSTNLILDNEVIVRYTVPAANSINEHSSIIKDFKLYPNPAKEELYFDLGDNASGTTLKKVIIYNTLGQNIFEADNVIDKVHFGALSPGVYFVKVLFPDFEISRKLIIE
ncbi:MAG: T9SS type A sorting domain-containing protein [Ignavibacteria bacterium]|nr:T9SS type A sorting domain-containing protein [Ignavibacteria bacterium]